LHNLYLGLGSFLSAISRATLPGLPVLASGFGWAATRSSLLTVSQVVPYATCQPGWHDGTGKTWEMERRLWPEFLKGNTESMWLPRILSTLMVWSLGD